MKLTLEQAREFRECVEHACWMTDDLYDLITDEISFLEREEEAAVESKGILDTLILIANSRKCEDSVDW